MSAQSPAGMPGSVEPGGDSPRAAKPTVEELGIDVEAQAWRRSGNGPGAIEIAFASAPPPGGNKEQLDEWVLMRVAGDPARRVLVYNRYEWECFLDGVKNGEFDNATA